MGLSAIVITWGGFLNTCSGLGFESSSSSSSCAQDGPGDGLIVGGGVAMAAGFVGLVAGIVLKVCNPAAKATQASVIHAVEIATTRLPTWNKARAREQAPGMPLVVPVFSAAF